MYASIFVGYLESGIYKGMKLEAIELTVLLPLPLLL
jgi:hypothetical protein